jgi:hypothetical protein
MQCLQHNTGCQGQGDLYSRVRMSFLMLTLGERIYPHTPEYAANLMTRKIVSQNTMRRGIKAIGSSKDATPRIFHRIITEERLYKDAPSLGLYIVFFTHSLKRDVVICGGDSDVPGR